MFRRKRHKVEKKHKAEKKNKKVQQVKAKKINKQRISLKEKGAQLWKKSCAFYHIYKGKIAESIRLEILGMVVIGFAIAGTVGLTVTQLARAIGIGEWTTIEYREQHDHLQQNLNGVVNELNSVDYTAEVEFDLDLAESDLEIIISEDQGERMLEDYLWREVSIKGFGYYHGDQHEAFINLLRNGENNVGTLYDSLRTLYLEGKWSNTAVQELIDQMLEAQGLGSEATAIKDLVVESIISDLNHGLYFTQDMLVYLLDGAGNNLYTDGIVKKIDITEVIKSTAIMDRASHETEVIYPVIINDEVHYLYASAILEGKQVTYYSDISTMIGVLVGVAIFVLILIKGTAKKIRYIEYLSHCLHEISKGDLNYHIEIEGKDQLAQVAKDIDYMEHQIKSQIDERMQAEKTKNDLITNVAHDLRTPLTSIIGYMALVKDKKYTSEEEAQRYLDIAYGKSEKLKILMEDLFEYTKLSNGAVEIKCDKLSVTTLINQLIDELSPLAEERNIRIQTYIKADDTSVHVDMMKMARVFENMIENAIKYSEEGKVVQIVVQAKDGCIYTTVRNRVIDMPEHDMEKLFERFYRTDASRNSNTGGSGLGLAIAKSIVDMHDGKIWAQMDNGILSITVKLKQ